MPETIKASEQNLNKVFCDDYVFEIPEYQRPYAWTTDEVGELLDDLLFAMGREEDVPYFLGSIVLIVTGYRTREFALPRWALQFGCDGGRT